MEEIDIIINLKKISKYWKNIKNYLNAKKSTEKLFYLFLLGRFYFFGGKWLNENVFYKKEKSISIDKVEIKVVLSEKIHMLT